MTTEQTIRGWLEDGKQNKSLTHVIIVCDTFDWEDYPVYVSSSDDVRKIYGKYDGRNMQKVMEVYSLNKNLEEQLAETRAFHFD